MTRHTRQTRAAHELLDAASRGVPVSMALITLALRITGDFPIYPLNRGLAKPAADVTMHRRVSGDNKDRT